MFAVAWRNPASVMVLMLLTALMEVLINCLHNSNTKCIRMLHKNSTNVVQNKKKKSQCKIYCNCYCVYVWACHIDKRMWEINHK